MRLLPLGIAVVALAAAAGCGSSSSSSQSGGGGASTVAHGQLDLFEDGTLTVGSDISYPPQEFYDSSHKPTGFDLDLGKALADRLGLRFKAVNQTFDGIIPALNAKKFDIIISAMSTTDTRKKQVAFVPYFNAGEALVVKQGASYAPTSADQLCGHSVAVEKGTIEADEITSVAGKCGSNPPKAQSYTTDVEAAEQIEKGAVDVYYTDSPVAAYDVKQKSDLRISSPVFNSSTEGIAVRMDDKQLQSAINDAFKAVRSDGTYSSLLAKWNLKDGSI